MEARVFGFSKRNCKNANWEDYRICFTMSENFEEFYSILNSTAEKAIPKFKEGGKRQKKQFSEMMNVYRL